jgi:fused signal recognition particle receptor
VGSAEVIVILQIVLAVLVIAGVAWFVVSRRRDDAALAGAPAAPPRPRTAGRITGRISKASQSLGGALRSVFGRGALDQEFWDSMEEALIGADVGVAASTDIVARIRERKPESTDDARRLLREELEAELSGRDRELNLGSKPAVIMVVGVNGTGKTTTIAKLAHRLKADGKVPLLGAADTFRAAADAQLRTWGDRLGVDVVGGQEGADPAAVAFDAFQAARSRGRDVVLVDTAGRLHSKHNLMAELAKIRRVLEKESAVDEVLLVLDATGGQNGISQAQVFTEAVGVTGIVLTKLDGTARGGVVVAVERLLGVPVKYVGVGEGMEDLVPFDPHEFVEALLADA